MKSAGASAVSAIYSGLSGLTSKVSSQLSAVTSKVSSWGSSLKSSFTSIGKNVISGMISGISSMVSSLYSSIKSALSGLVSKAKSALGIHSPSTEMRDEVGVQILPGVGEGIEETTGDLYDTMGDAMNGLVAAAEETELTPELTATVALEPDTTAIEEKLADLSAAIELHLPDIAPYLDQMEAAVELRIAEITARVDARANTGSGVVSALDSEKIDYYFVGSSANLASEWSWSLKKFDTYSSIDDALGNLTSKVTSGYWIPPKAGFFVANFLVRFASNSKGNRGAQICIYDSSSNQVQTLSRLVAPAASQQQTLTVTAAGYLNPSSTAYKLGLEVAQNSGSTLSVYATARVLFIPNL